MVAPLPPITVTVDVPIQAELFQANHDLRTEISTLHAELSTRVQVIDTHLTSQRTDQLARRG
jgi:hypothetical protein